MISRLFISYRRDDSAGYAGRLYDRLEREFGRDHLVMDVDAIPLGANFVKVLGDEVAKCDLLLAIIGPGWLEARDEEGNRRLENPQDFVRIEIGTALKRDIPVIPILLEGTRIPKADQLPDDLKELPLRNGLNVRHVSFLDDLERLIRGLKRAQSLQQLEPIASSLVDKSPQQSAEEEAQRKAAEEAEARCKQETAEWGTVVASTDTEAIWAFLQRWPDGPYADAAWAHISALEREAAEARAVEQERAQETAEWGTVVASTDTEAIWAFLERWPDGQYADAARAHIAALEREAAEARAVEQERKRAEALERKRLAQEAQREAQRKAAEEAETKRRRADEEEDRRRAEAEARQVLLGASRTPLVLASVFAFASLLVQGTISRVLFSGMKWSWFGAGNEFTSGQVAGGMLVVMSALALVRWRGAEITGTEVTLYWLGSSLAVVVAMGNLFSGMKWSWFGPGYEAPSGLLAGGMLVVMSALALVRWRGAEITGTEVTLYWLGSSLAVVVAMSALFSGMEWSWFGPGYEAPSGLLAGGMLAAIIRVILRRLLRQRAAA